MTKTSIKIFFVIVSLMFSSFQAKPETYFKADFTSANFYIDVLGIWGTYAINKKIAELDSYNEEGKRGFVIDNFLTFTTIAAHSDRGYNGMHISSSSDNINTVYSFRFPQILNGLGTGVKWGYKKTYLSSFFKSWAAYTSLHTTFNYYTLEMYKYGEGTEKYGNSILKLSPGIGASMEFGSVESPVSMMLDLNLRYDIPVIYSGEFGSGPGCLNSGFSPRISLIFGGPKLRDKGMNVGVFFEFSTYNLFKNSEYFNDSYSVKTMAFGINFTIFPFD